MKLWAVGLFGIAGALLRYLGGLWVRDWWALPFPLGTLLINYAGCLVLGWFAAWAAFRPKLPDWLRLGLGTGLVGAFTTFSTFSVEAVSLVQTGRPGTALLYVLASGLGGFALAWLGYGIARRPRRQNQGEVRAR